MRPILLILLLACGAPDEEGATATTPTSPVTSTGSTPTTSTGSTPTTPTNLPHGGNILLVVIDDIGIDKIRSYRPDAPNLPPQPTLDRLADEGVRFENMWVGPTCTPTRAMLMSGRYPHQTGLGLRVDFDGVEELALGEVTLPELTKMGPHAYQTAAVGKWHLASWVSALNLQHPIASGFDHFQGSMSNLIGDYYSWEKAEDGVEVTETVYATTDNVDDAVAWLDATPEPWFLYLAFNAPHTPIQAPPDDLTTIKGLGPGAGQVENWNGSVEALDMELGRLLDSLDPAVAANTTVMVIGDNGTYDGVILEPYDYQRSKGSMFEGGIRVPFLVSGPYVEQPGSVTETLVTAVDIWPTIAEMAQTDMSQVPLLNHEGISLVPWIVDPDAPVTRTMVYMDDTNENNGPPYVRHRRSVRDARWKLMVDDLGNGLTFALFDFESSTVDEGEPILPADVTPEQAAAMDTLYQHLLDLEARTPYSPQK